ncbi:F-box/kelch-repeat protein [Trifolium repens]|nr:F-box/kelch-repeat protein [Trifolium repens]
MENKKVPPYLPSELVTQFLLKLPVKSLIRFKCVCKSWFSLISHPNFANSQFHLSQSTHNRRILCPSNLYYKFRSIDFESSINHESTSLNLNWLPQSYFLREIKGSCRGFIFLHGNSKFYLWNPSTGFHRPIPFSSFYSNFQADWCTTRHLYGFGYDQSRDDYLLVLFSYKTYGAIEYNNLSPHLEFFSSRDNTWTEVEGPHFSYRISFRRHNVGTFFNGAIHWSAYRRDLMADGKVIAVFDLMGRKLLDMSLPHDLNHVHVNYDLLVSGEFLGLCVMQCDNHGYYNNKFVMWVMKDYKLHSSWTKILDIDFPTLNFFPICFTKSGDIIGTEGEVGLIKYNDKGQRLEYCKDFNRLDRFKVAVYTESLLSLPGKFEQD